MHNCTIKKINVLPAQKRIKKCEKVHALYQMDNQSSADLAHINNQQAGTKNWPTSCSKASRTSKIQFQKRTQDTSNHLILLGGHRRVTGGGSDGRREKPWPPPSHGKVRPNDAAAARRRGRRRRGGGGWRREREKKAKGGWWIKAGVNGKGRWYYYCHTEKRKQRLKAWKAAPSPTSHGSMRGHGGSEKGVILQRAADNTRRGEGQETRKHGVLAKGGEVAGLQPQKSFYLLPMPQVWFFISGVLLLEGSSFLFVVNF